MSSGDRVEAYLLAAGYGERISASKPMLPFGGCTVLSRMMSAFVAGGVQSVRVIGRADDSDLAREAFLLGMRYVVNHEPQRGMAGSIIEALEDCRSEWMAVCPSDLPLLQQSTVQACVSTLQSAAHEVVQPECDGRRRHPVFLRASVALTLRETLANGGTLRTFIEGRDVTTVPIEECAQFRDIDTMDDYQEMLAQSGFGGN